MGEAHSWRGLSALLGGGGGELDHLAFVKKRVDVESVEAQHCCCGQAVSGCNRTDGVACLDRIRVGDVGRDNVENSVAHRVKGIAQAFSHVSHQIGGVSTLAGVDGWSSCRASGRNVAGSNNSGDEGARHEDGDTP